MKRILSLQDTYGRIITYLRLSVTDRCNLRCRYCMPEAGVESLPHDAILSYEELLRIVASAVRLGVRKVRVTGGEPLVRRGLVGFIGQLRGLAADMQVTLTTNGLLLAEMAESLQSAGLARVNVSLDSLRAERFQEITRRDGLAEVLRGIEVAERVGLRPVKINMVPIRGVNDDEIEAFAGLSRDRGWEVRFIEYMPISSGLDYPAARRVPAEEIEARLATLGRLERLASSLEAGPARIFRIAGFAGRVGIIPAVSQHFCAECNRLRITADGRIRPCLFSTEEIDLRQPLRSGVADAALDQLLLEAVGCKPEGHRIGEEDFAHASRLMHGIGG